MDISAQPFEIGEITKLRQKLDSTNLPPDLQDKAATMINRAAVSFKYSGHLSGFDQVASYIDWITSLPWDKRSTDNIVINEAKEILDKHHYGLREIKDRILEYLAVMKLKIDSTTQNTDILNFAHAPILFF